MTMKKYTKRKPDIVRAVQFTGENADEILREFCGSWVPFSVNVTWETRGGSRLRTFRRGLSYKNYEWGAYHSQRR